MTIHFYLKPNNYSFPPSGIPIFDGEARRKKKRKEARKLYIEELKARAKKLAEEDLLMLLLKKIGLL